MAIINRKYFNGIDYFLDKQKQVLKLAPTFFKILQEKKLYGGRGFKKVGGSSIGDFLLTDSFKSQFAAFCNIANLGMPILDEKYVKAGVAIEKMVVAAIEEKNNFKVETFDPFKYNFDYFADKDDVLGGIPDGFVKERELIIEIKTTNIKNLEKWTNNGVPLHYCKQAAQYAYLMGVPNYAIVATFLQDEDYAQPEKYPIRKRIIKTYPFKVDKNQVEDDIVKIKNLYQIWTSSGISPQYNPVLDADLLEWLSCSSVQEWEVLKNKWIKNEKYIP